MNSIIDKKGLPGFREIGYFAKKGQYAAGGINVVPKREWDEHKKLGSAPQQKTHAY